MTLITFFGLKSNDVNRNTAREFASSMLKLLETTEDISSLVDDSIPWEFHKVQGYRLVKEPARLEQYCQFGILNTAHKPHSRLVYATKVQFYLREGVLDAKEFPPAVYVCSRPYRSNMKSEKYDSAIVIVKGQEMIGDAIGEILKARVLREIGQLNSSNGESAISCNLISFTIV